MRHLFLPDTDLTQPALTIAGTDAHHLATVLRARPGELLTILDNRGNAVEAEIVEVGKKRIETRALGPAPVAPEPPIRVTVAQALGKGDKFEQVVQHGTEVGASEFVPLVTERATVRLDSRSTPEKQARWELIAKNAAEQSGRARIPAVGRMMTVPDLVREVEVYERIFVLDPSGQPLEEALRIPAICAMSGARAPEFLVAVGPEGGFTPGELEALRAGGAYVVSLGDHILRTETAAIVAVTLILFAHRAGMLPEGTV